MLSRKYPGFESLENRLCLSVNATVSGGDLIVSGDADGAVEIVAVGQGSYRVTDNGVVVADETVLQNVDDDITIRLEQSIDGTNDTVTLDLTALTENVDKVYADLGDGDNSFEIIGGSASGLTYRGGDGIDSVSIGSSIEGRAFVKLGDGDNDLTVNGAVGNLTVHGGDGADLIAIASTAVINGGASVELGNGDNSMTLAGTVDGHLVVSAREGADTVTVAEGATIGRSAKIALGNGQNSATIAGAVDGNVSYDGRDGNDTVALTATAAVAGNFSARLGEGDNSVTHDGTVEGDFRVVSANANDVVTIAATAVIGGEQDLGLGEQVENDGRGGCGGGREFGVLQLNGRQLGFFFRGARR